MEIEKWVTIDVDLSDFDDDVLIAEIEHRNLDINADFRSAEVIRDAITSMWQKKRLGQDYTREVEDIIYFGINKVI